MQRPELWFRRSHWFGFRSSPSGSSSPLSWLLETIWPTGAVSPQADQFSASSLTLENICISWLVGVLMAVRSAPCHSTHSNPPAAPLPVRRPPCRSACSQPLRVLHATRACHCRSASVWSLDNFWLFFGAILIV